MSSSLPSHPFLRVGLMLLLTLSLSPGGTHAATPPGHFDPAAALTGISRDVLKDLYSSSAKKSEPARDKANQQIKTNLTGKTGTMRIKISEVSLFSTGYHIHSMIQEIKVEGIAFDFSSDIMLDPSQNAAAAKLKRGDNVTLTGPLHGAFYKGLKPSLRVDMQRAVLK